MPHGTALTDIEKGEIIALKYSGSSGREIARQIGRSRAVIQNFLKDPASYGSTKRTGCKRSLNKWDESASNSTMSSSRLRFVNGLNVLRSTICRSLKGFRIICNEKMKRIPKLFPLDKSASLTFALNYLSTMWNQVTQIKGYFKLAHFNSIILRSFFQTKRNGIWMDQMGIEVIGTTYGRKH